MHDITRYTLHGSSFYFIVYVLSSIPFNDIGMFILKLFGKV